MEWVFVFLVVAGLAVVLRKGRKDHVRSSGYDEPRTRGPLPEAPIEHRDPPRRSPGIGLRIEYADAFGEITVRDIIVMGVAEEPATGAVYVRARCLLRSADRTFRADRILRATRDDGSVIVNPTSYFRQVAPDLGGIQWWGGLSPEAVRDQTEHNRAMDRARAGVNGLVWLAAADGEVSEPEVAVILDWIEMRAKASRSGAAKWSRDQARVWVRTAAPTLASLEGGLARMGKAEASAFREAVDRLMDADGRRDAREERRARQLLARLP